MVLDTRIRNRIKNNVKFILRHKIVTGSGTDEMHASLSTVVDGSTLKQFKDTIVFV